MNANTTADRRLETKTSAMMIDVEPGKFNSRMATPESTQVWHLEEDDEDADATFAEEYKDRVFTFQTLGKAQSGTLAQFEDPLASDDYYTVANKSSSSSTGVLPEGKFSPILDKPSTGKKASLSSTYIPSNSTTTTTGDSCVVCKQEIKTNKSGSYRSDNFLKEYRALFPDFDMSCGQVCYTCYYQCYQFRKKRKVHPPASSSSSSSTSEDLYNQITPPKKRMRTFAATAMESANFADTQTTTTAIAQDITPDTSRSMRKKKRKYTEEPLVKTMVDEQLYNGTPNASAATDEAQQQEDGDEAFTPRRRGRKPAKDDSGVIKKTGKSGYVQRLREFDCCCCGRHEPHGRMYTYKTFADVYSTLFPNYLGDDGGVCRHCYSLGYKFRTWRKSNPTDSPSKFMESNASGRQKEVLEQAQQQTSGSSSPGGEQSSAPTTSSSNNTNTSTDATSPKSKQVARQSSPSADMETVEALSSLSKRRKFTRGGSGRNSTAAKNSSDDDEEMSDELNPSSSNNTTSSNVKSRRATSSAATPSYSRPRTREKASVEAQQFVEVFGDDLVEVFLDLRVKQTNGQSYDRQKIVREFIPSRSTRNSLVELAQRYANSIFSRPMILHAAKPLKQENDGNNMEEDSEVPARDVSNNLLQLVSCIPPRHVISDIKLAERDSNGVDLEVDLLTDDCFANRPVKSKSRFIAFVDVQ